MTYQERLPVPVWWWLIGVGVVGSVALAVFAYLGPWQAWTLVGIATVMVAVGLASYTMRITVDARGLTVGRNTLEPEYLGEARPVEGDVRADTDATSHMLTRPWVRGKVRVVVDDEADPHAAWIISTGRPEALAAAIEEARR